MAAKRIVKIALVTAAVAAVAVVYFVFDPSSSASLFPKCPFYWLTGYKCPGCGSQRALHALLHADVITAFRHNALLVISLPVIAAMLIASHWRTRFPRLYARLNSTTVITATAITILSWWLLRNLLHT